MYTKAVLPVQRCVLHLAVTMEHMVSFMVISDQVSEQVRQLATRGMQPWTGHLEFSQGHDSLVSKSRCRPSRCAAR